MLIITVLDRSVQGSPTADEVDMQLPHSQVIAPYSAIHWPKHEAVNSWRSADLHVSTAAVVCGGYVCDMHKMCARVRDVLTQ